MEQECVQDQEAAGAVDVGAGFGLVLDFGSVLDADSDDGELDSVSDLPFELGLSEVLGLSDVLERLSVR